MTYNVFGGTLNLALSLSRIGWPNIGGFVVISDHVKLPASPPWCSCKARISVHVTPSIVLKNVEMSSSSSSSSNALAEMSAWQAIKRRAIYPRWQTDRQTDSRTDGWRMEGKQTSVRRQSKHVMACGLAERWGSCVAVARQRARPMTKPAVAR